jgi:hypothetical protein
MAILSRRARWLLGIAGAALLVISTIALLVASVLTPPALPAVARAAHVLGPVEAIEPGAWRRTGVEIRVRDGRIEAIGEAAGGTAGEWAGRYVLPGLVDLHVHLPHRVIPGGSSLLGLLFLRHGVTTVRDAGSPFGDALAVARRIADGDLTGPRVHACGPFVDGERARWPGSLRARRPADAADVVRELRARGADCMKLYNDLSPPTARALIAAARAAGLRVLAHVPDESPLAAYRGAEIQHLMNVVDDWSDVGPAQVRRVLERTRELHLQHTPTIVGFAAYGGLSPDGAGEGRADRWLPRFVRDGLWNARRNPLIEAMYGSDRGYTRLRAEAMLRITRALVGADLPVLLGTDSPNPGLVPGRALHDEMRWWQRSGVPLERIWQVATRDAGRALGSPLLGRITVGAPADLLVFREDPTRDLRALSTLEAVLADGRLYRRQDLDAALEAQRVHFEQPLYDTLTWGIADRLLPDGN